MPNCTEKKIISDTLKHTSPCYLGKLSFRDIIRGQLATKFFGGLTNPPKTCKAHQAWIHFIQIEQMSFHIRDAAKMPLHFLYR